MTGTTSYNQPLTVYHGTFWERSEPDEAWEDVYFGAPDPGYNDDGVVYFSQSAEVAERFSSWRSSGTEDGKVHVILRGDLRLCNPFLHGDTHEIELDGEVYDYPMDRDELYTLLRSAGHDAYIVPHNYGQDQDDIAVLEHNAFSPDAVKLQIEGAWTDWLDVQDALDLLEAGPTPAP